MALFIGRIGRDVRTKDMEEAFGKYGKLKRCEIKGTTLHKLNLHWRL